jgi:pyruvate/2-oxoglutarate dehydrogenase complex dihydrolipoamide acyltransferase (E2) component
VSATPISIPKLGVAMTEGVLVKWLVPDGQPVAPGDVIYVLETEKVESEIEAPAGGTLRHIAEEGGTYPVGTQVGEIS